MANRGAGGVGGVLSWRRWISAWLLYVLHCLINKNAKVFVFPSSEQINEYFLFIYFFLTQMPVGGS